MGAATYDVAVIGAGIVGAACAAELAAAGLRAVVIEPDIIGGGATSAGMGQVVVMDDSEAQFALCRYSQQLWDQLAPTLPRQCEFERCGTVWFAADGEEMAEARRKRDYYAARGVESELLDARALAEAEPNLRGGLAGGLLVPGDSVLYSPLAAVELIRRATERGAEVLVGPRVVEFDEGEIVLNDGSRVSVGAIVLATGALAARLLPGLEVRPRKGHLVITDRYPGFIRHQTVELGYLKSAHSRDAESVAFNIQPRATGQLLIGSSRQFGASDLRVDREIVGRMLRRAFEFMPGLRALQAIRVWTGFRAATPDGLPIVGPHPERPGLWLATGHEGLGITTSLGSARLLADRMLGRPTAIPIEPYLPDRFAHQAAAHG